MFTIPKSEAGFPEKLLAINVAEIVAMLVVKIALLIMVSGADSVFLRSKNKLVSAVHIERLWLGMMDTETVTSVFKEVGQFSSILYTEGKSVDVTLREGFSVSLLRATWAAVKVELKGVLKVMRIMVLSRISRVYEMQQVLPRFSYPMRHSHFPAIRWLPAAQLKHTSAEQVKQRSLQARHE